MVPLPTGRRSTPSSWASRDGAPASADSFPNPLATGVEHVSWATSAEPGGLRAASAATANAIRPRVRSAIRRSSPLGPVVARRRITAMSPRSTWAVQMLLVAFARRMCCSRVCKRQAAALAGPPHRGTTPTRRPGRRRRWPTRGGHEAAWGPPYPSGTPEALGRADRHVGAALAGSSISGERQQID